MAEFDLHSYTFVSVSDRGTATAAPAGLTCLNDAAAALDWLQLENPNARTFWIGGFSFGAWISLQLLMRRPEIKGFVSVAPPANVYDFAFLAPCPTSGVVIQGRRDTIVPEPHVEKLVQRLRAQKGIAIDYRVIDGAGHFFDEHIDILTNHIHDHMNKAGSGRMVKPALKAAA